MAGKYIAYTKKTVSWLNKLAQDHHLNRLWVYWDYASAVVRHRCLIRQYVIGDFWRLSNPERRKRLTYHRIVKLFDKYNKKDFVHFLNEKNDFNAYFKNFVHRDWLYSGSSTEEEFEVFVKKHDAVIIKPMDGVEGNGIRKFVYSENPGTDLKKLFGSFNGMGGGNGRRDNSPAPSNGIWQHLCQHHPYSYNFRQAG